MNHFYKILLIFISIGGSYAQSYKIPFLETFNEEDYGIVSQNKVIAEDHLGNILVGNGNGLLTKIGNEWKLMTLNNQSGVVSLVKCENGILVGGQGEFGIYNYVFGDYNYQCFHNS